MNKLQNRYL